MTNAEGLTNWNLTPSECIALQKKLKQLVSRRWDGRRIDCIAGTDVHFPEKGTVRAAIVVLSYPSFEYLESQIHTGEVTFPYIPGLLSFREIPPLLAAWRKLKRIPDIILCDGQGIAHPRGLGLASHLGLVLDRPTVGCAKSPLFGSFREPGKRRGSRSAIVDRSGRTIGTVLRTRDNTKPIFVSVGHRIDLRTAVRLALTCSPRYRIPEPLRAAHRLAGHKG
jgi:deoxyribonuclease V